MTTRKAYDHVFKMSHAYLISQSIFTVGMLGVPDLLTHGPMPIESIAEKVGADEDALYRVMRLLSSQEIFIEEADKHFALNDAADYLRRGTKHSFLNFALLINNSPAPFDSVHRLLDCVKTGKTSFVQHFGKPVFDFIAEDPSLAEMVDAGMAAAHTQATEAFLDAYDLSSTGVFADIGGGRGEVVSKVLEKYQDIQGIIFDLPHVADRTRQLFSQNGYKDRCEVIPGDFHVDVPVHADVYFLRQILHDWTDAQCINILRNIGRHARPGSRLLIADCLIKERAIQENANFYDVLMLYITGGRERTEKEFKAIFEASGFILTNIVETEFWFGAVEGRYEGGI